LTSDALQNNPRCQDVELNFALRNWARANKMIQGEFRERSRQA
jgi:hypothetical protein